MSLSDHDIEQIMIGAALAPFIVVAIIFYLVISSGRGNDGRK